MGNQQSRGTAGVPGASGRELADSYPNFLPDRGLILGSAAPSGDTKRRLVRFAPLLLAQSLPRKGFFGPALLAGFHVEAMFLDFLNDVFLLHLALETAQGIFQRLAFLND